MSFSLLPSDPEIERTAASVVRPDKVVTEMVRNLHSGTVMCLEDMVSEIVKWLPRQQLVRLAHTCKAWIRPCQAIIFRSINLRRHVNSDKLMLLLKLLDVLESSPHLTGLIHRFDISLSPLVLDRIAALPLQSLLACTLNCWVEMRSEMNTAIPLAQSIIRRPTLRNIRFHGHFFSPAILNEVLAGCSRNIVELDVTKVRFSTRDNTDGERISITEPKINLSSLVVGEGVLGWLLDRANEFNFSHLSILQLPSLRLLADLPLSLGCVQDLKIFGPDFDVIVNSSIISAMRSLRIVRIFVGLGQELNNLLNILRALPLNNVLQVLELTMDLVSLDIARRRLYGTTSPGEENRLKKPALDFDAALATCPNLTKSLKIHLCPVEPPALAEVTQVQKYFPQSGAKFCMDIPMQDGLA
ncbi:hypothetical protein B0H10DRAFT_2196198 [Mycena sp. CBHHK59/15]|nr:hypothetical protein B0H10DRAFT_2196198 [Mycena sp. CBHHK59/15]